MKSLILFGITFLLIGCSYDLTDKKKNEIAKEIENVVNKFADAKTLSFETHTGFRADKEGYVFAGDGKILFTNYNDYKEYTRSLFKNVQRFTEMRVIQNKVYVLAENAAVSTFEFQSKILTTSGDTLPNNGCYTFVFKKFDEGWKIIQENGTHTR